jgi:hypothetical protein
MMIPMVDMCCLMTIIFQIDIQMFFGGHVPRFYFWTDPLWSVENLRNSWDFALLSTLQAGETWAGVMEPSPQKV